MNKHMNKQERYKTIVDMIPQIEQIRDIIYNIVWEPQEGDFNNHFDNLPKAEKVAIIGILNDAHRLLSSAANYESWFKV